MLLKESRRSHPSLVGPHPGICAIKPRSPYPQNLKTPTTKLAGLIAGAIAAVCTNTGRYWRQRDVPRPTEQAGTSSLLKTASHDN
jgi:hypothetical protein